MVLKANTCGASAKRGADLVRGGSDGVCVCTHCGSYVHMEARMCTWWVWCAHGGDIMCRRGGMGRKRRGGGGELVERVELAGFEHITVELLRIELTVKKLQGFEVLKSEDLGRYQTAEVWVACVSNIILTLISCGGR